MAKFANIKIELRKITQLADVQLLKKEIQRLTAEIRKRGESEITQIDKTVRQARARVQKLQKQIEKEVAKIRRQVGKGGSKKPAAKTRKKSSVRRKTTRKATRR